VTPLERLLGQLPDAKPAGQGQWAARCPAHEDRHASLSISEGDDGRALMRCHAGCSVDAIVEALGLTVRDLFPGGHEPHPTFNGQRTHPGTTSNNGRARTSARPGQGSGRAFPTAEAAVKALERQLGPRAADWTYHDDAGNPVGMVLRWDRADGTKDIRPVALHADGWHIGAMPEPRPLCRLPDLASATRVLVTEGEKCAEAARGLGFIATTSAGGSQAAGKTDWRPLAGKEIWILPDNDAPGRKYADTVAAALAKLTPAPAVRIVHLPGLPDRGDLMDWLAGLPDSWGPDEVRQELERLAAGVEPDGVDLPDVAGRFEPFPVGALPEPIRGFVGAGARAIGCDPSYLALPLLVALGAAVGNTRRLELKRGWSVPPILWGAIVGESGTAKTPAFTLALRPFRDRQTKALKRHADAMKRHEADLARWDKAMAAWKRSKADDARANDPPEKPAPPAAERLVVADTTVEALAPMLSDNPRGLLLARDELAGWFGSFDRYAGRGKAGADAPNWLSLFNGEGITVDRRTSRTIHVPRAAVWVIGGIQPGVLQRALGAEHRESGLAARLLLACPPRRVKRWTEADIDPRAEADLARVVDRLYGLQPAVDDDGAARPSAVYLTPDAKAVWTAYYDAHAAEQADLTGDLSAAWSKLEEYPARLALVVHFVRWAADDPTLASPDRLDADSMAAGIELATWFKHEARRVYALLDESDADRDARRLVEWIERKGGLVTARDVQMGCRWLREPGAAEAALEALARTGRGAWRDVVTTSNGGRPTRVFVLHTSPTSTKPQ
jgi:hypothetical protein